MHGNGLRLINYRLGLERVSLVVLLEQCRDSHPSIPHPSLRGIQLYVGGTNLVQRVNPCRPHPSLRGIGLYVLVHRPSPVDQLMPIFYHLLDTNCQLALKRHDFSSKHLCSIWSKGITAKIHVSA
jgi:hypothetical protein